MRFSMLSRFIRLPNLLLSAISLFLVYYITTSEFLPIKSASHFLLLSLEIITVLVIMAGGNIYNDLMDQETDRINRPESLIVGSVISAKQASLWYRFSVAVAILLTLVIYILTGNLWMVFYHFLAIGLLNFYSKTGKGAPWIGNLIVAFLCALVFPAIPLLFTQSLPAGWWYPDHKIGKIVILFSTFSFFTTLWRELVKDIEDRLGDQKAGHETLPVLWSPRRVKYFGSIFILMLFVLLLYTSIFFFTKGELSRFFYSVTLVISLVYLFIRFIQAKTKTEHHALSGWLKLFMLQGLLLLLFLGP